MAIKNYCLVCNGSMCKGKDKADAIYFGLRSTVIKAGISENTQIVKTGCFGLCEKGPIVKVLPEEVFYINVQPEDAETLITEHIVKGELVDRLLYKTDTADGSRQECVRYHQKQKRFVLRNCGVIDPESIDDYIARDGYIGLAKALFEMSNEQLIEELKTSGLRGRGGAGFATWLKWKFTADVESDIKYVVCNADEGDPGAYMDRATLEGDPHSILEAMTIAGKTVGSHHGVIYIRAEYPLAIKRLQIALSQSREYGLLGEDILGSGFNFDIEIRFGAGAFVCGEETALLASIEGNRGMPTPKPPFPAVKGLFEKPTVINNVETLANIPLIIAKGGDWFSGIGTEGSPGTKVFALTGKIENSGLVEVPMGTTLREIVYNIGGGICGGKEFKAVQTGGPSGGVITKDYLDTPIDFDSLKEIGSMMGSGGMIVLDEDDCIIDVTKFYMGFCVEESCGKCAPCRIGTRRMYQILGKISKGLGTIEDLGKLRAIGLATQNASLCGLGQTAGNPILSTLKYFEHEYLEHIREKKCRAGKCKDLVTYAVDAEKCIGCTVCARKCPVHCISGERKAPHRIEQSKCVKCGACYDSCKFGAIKVS